LAQNYDAKSPEKGDFQEKNTAFFVNQQPIKAYLGISIDIYSYF